MLRDYLSLPVNFEDGTRSAADLLKTRLRNYFFWKSALGRMTRNLKPNRNGTQGANGSAPEPENAALKRKREYKKGQPSYKRRRVRGGGVVSNSSRARNNGVGAGDSELLEAEAGEVADL